MEKFKVMVIALICMMSFGTTNAQDKVEAEISADVVSNYIWRGQLLGEGSFQPSVGLSYKGLSLEAWGNFGFVNADDDKEFDITLSYTTGGFNIGITDYFFTTKGDDVKYFLYDAHNTAHTFEANIGYDFGPVALQWYTNFAGADGVNKKGKRAYSSYVEAIAPFTLGGLDWEAAVGAVPYKTDFYDTANGFAVTNVSVKAAKDIKITDSFCVPVFAQIMANPSTQKAYFALGFTLKP